MSGAFSGRGARWLAAVAAFSLLASAALAMLGDVFDVPSAGADAFSRSALGHHALVALWRDLGFRVLVSRHRTAGKVTPVAALVVAEPTIGGGRAASEKLAAMLAASRRTILVLPKRAGMPHAYRPAWIGRQFVVPAQQVTDVLRAAGIEGEVVRVAATIGTWEGDLPRPTVDDEPQLVRSKALWPLLSTREGILVGGLRRDKRELLVVSDPDVLATHGLGRGDNAVLAARLAEWLAGGRDGALVVDETLHGHELEPSLAREFLRWPLVLGTIQAALALALAAWAALVRFGRPLREARALAPGKRFLIENTADLLRHGGHGGAGLARYWRASKDHVARVLRDPGAPGAASETVDAWLARLALARGRAAALDALEQRVATLSARRGGEELVRAALAIHAFREDLTHGSAPHP